MDLARLFLGSAPPLACEDFQHTGAEHGGGLPATAADRTAPRTPQQASNKEYLVLTKAMERLSADLSDAGPRGTTINQQATCSSTAANRQPPYHRLPPA